MGRQKASLLEDFLDSDKAPCGLPLARFGLTLPSPRPPCCSGGRQRGTLEGASTLGMLGGGKEAGWEVPKALTPALDAAPNKPPKCTAWFSRSSSKTGN